MAWKKKRESWIMAMIFAIKALQSLRVIVTWLNKWWSLLSTWFRIAWKSLWLVDIDSLAFCLQSLGIVWFVESKGECYSLPHCHTKKHPKINVEPRCDPIAQLPWYAKLMAFQNPRKLLMLFYIPCTSKHCCVSHTTRQACLGTCRCPKFWHP